MAARKRINWAKAQIWGPLVTSKLEGPIKFIATEAFGAMRDRVERQAALQDMQERHLALCELEDQLVAGTTGGRTVSNHDAMA